MPPKRATDRCGHRRSRRGIGDVELHADRPVPVGCELRRSAPRRRRHRGRRARPRRRLRRAPARRRAPIPPAPPVTTATLPVKSKSSSARIALISAPSSLVRATQASTSRTRSIIASWTAGSVSTRKRPPRRPRRPPARRRRRPRPRRSPAHRGTLGAPKKVICSTMFVLTPAGQRQVTPTPFGRRYSASDSDIPTTACFEVTYGSRSQPCARSPDTDAVLTTCPRPCSISSGRKTRLLRTMPSTLTSRTRCHASSGKRLGRPHRQYAHVVHHDVDATESCEARVADAFEVRAGS